MRKHTWILLIAFILFFIPTVLFAYTNLEKSDPTPVPLVTISSEQCPFRDGPNTDSQLIGYAEKGQVYEVVSRFRGVLGLQMETGIVGYIPFGEAKSFEQGSTNQEIIQNSSYSGCSFIEVEQPKSVGFYLGAGVGVAKAAELDLSPDFTEPGVPEEQKNPESDKVQLTMAEKPEPVVEPEVKQVSETVKPEAKPIVETVEEKEPIVELKPEPEVEVEPEVKQEVVAVKTEPTVSSQSQSNGLTQEEKNMYQLINDLRSSKGLCLVEIDCELRDIARIKSNELVERDYFSHTSPVYGSPKEMLDYFKVDYDYMGEVLAFDRNAKSAFDAFCNSKQHHDILLNPVFDRIGVGIQVDDDMIIVTVLFIDKP